jgi:hypothetical protein
MAERGNATCSTLRKGHLLRGGTPSVPPQRCKKQVGRRTSLCKRMPGPNLAPQKIVGGSPVVNRVPVQVTLCGANSLGQVGTFLDRSYNHFGR